MTSHTCSDFTARRCTECDAPLDAKARVEFVYVRPGFALTRCASCVRGAISAMSEREDDALEGGFGDHERAPENADFEAD